MPRKTQTEGALYVRLPTTAVDKLDRAAEALGMRKKDLVAGLVTKYVDPDSRRGLTALGALSTRKVTIDLAEPRATVGSYSFRAYEPTLPPGPPAPPEVMNAEQAGQFLQIDEQTVVALAESGKLPGRKLGAAWRFSRAALVTWLATPEKRR